MSHEIESGINSKFSGHHSKVKLGLWTFIHFCIMQRALEATQVNKDRRRIKTPLTVKIQQANKKIDSDCSAKILKNGSD